MNKAERKIIRDEFDAAINTRNEYIAWYDEQYRCGIKEADEHAFRQRIILSYTKDLKRSIFSKLGIAE